MPKLKRILTDVLYKNYDIPPHSLSEPIDTAFSRLEELLNYEYKIDEMELDSVIELQKSLKTEKDAQSLEKKCPLSQNIIGRQLNEAGKHTPNSFRINDRMMEPRFREGECVMIDTASKPSADVQPFVVSDGHYKMVRLCRKLKGRKKQLIEVSALSKTFAPQTLEVGEFKVIGKVIGKLSWI